MAAPVGGIGFKPSTGALKGTLTFKNSSKDTTRAIGSRFTSVPVPAARKAVAAAAAAPARVLTTAVRAMELPPTAPIPVAEAATVVEAPSSVAAPPAKAVRFAEQALTPAGGAGIAEEEEAPVVAAAAPKLKISEKDVDPKSQLEPAAVLALKRQLARGAPIPKGIVPPTSGPQTLSGSALTTEFKDTVARTKQRQDNPIEQAPKETLTVATPSAEAGKPESVIASGPVYLSANSPEFPYFMIQTYKQYSKALSSLIRGADGKLKIPAKVIDKDACKKFDPNKVETFYYQKLVRDYLNGGSPYRGSLLYHGLGSGKTCTSIAAAEALYWGGRKRIFVLTPATLSNNYRRELAKCGYYQLRRHNQWSFMPADETKPARAKLLTDALGIPEEVVAAQKGGWIANPDAPSNWETLSVADRDSIKRQQDAHLNARFRFIHYNGVSPPVLAGLAEASIREGKSVFDDAVVIIDEVHNLVRTINGTRLGGRSVSEIMDGGIEPREFNWTMPLRRERPGYRYPRGYTLYRLLQNAVNAKIICMSATPMINYAQELAILMNIIGGDQRVVEIPLSNLRSTITEEERAAIRAENEAAVKRSADFAAKESARKKEPVAPIPPVKVGENIMGAIDVWAKYHPEIDYYVVEDSASGTAPVLRLTPVPHGFHKVAAADYPMRGFLRMKAAFIPSVEKSRERNMDLWGASLVSEMETRGFFTKAGRGEEAIAAVRAAREAGAGTKPATTTFSTIVYPLLPDNGDVFVPNFVDRATLKLMNRNVLIARCSGIVSYYKGGSEELMPRLSRNEVVRVPMSEYMFKEYTRARMKELEMEGIKPEEGGAAAPAKRKGMTAAEQDLYAVATKAHSAGFKSATRAACNWVFPEEIPRPKFSKDEELVALGLDNKERLIAVDLAESTDIEQAPAASVAAGEEEEVTGPAGEAVLPDEGVAEADVEPTELMVSKMTKLLFDLETSTGNYLSDGLETFSPKYAAIQENIRTSPGPVLVYSQFKTLEGLGLFAAALRASPEEYVQLDIEQDADGDWRITEEAMEPGKNRYILYTGDQSLDKRRLLLQIYNADVTGLPPGLSEQCAELLDGAPDNRDGRVARVFMITQSGAEGISLFNTRQVHIMEPYWNNVRLQQVIGRAIRTCSHMNLDWDEREVSVFTYLSVFTDEQKASSGARQIMMYDSAMTTDEVIFDIATKKQKLADELSAVLQEGAIDCELHRHENELVGQCFKFSKGSRPNFLWHPNWQRDIQQMASLMRAAKSAAPSTAVAAGTKGAASVKITTKKT